VRKIQKTSFSERIGNRVFFSYCRKTNAYVQYVERQHKGNLERHFRIMRTKSDTEFPPKTEIRKKQTEKLKLEIDFY